MAPDPDRFPAAEQLPALPVAVRTVLELARAPGPDIRGLVEAVEHDPWLAAKIMQAANSSSAGTNQAVQSVEQAVLLLGTLTLTHLVLTFAAAGEGIEAGAVNEPHPPPENPSLLAELRHRAFRDHLTGIYNRFFFEETLTREHSRCVRYRESMGLIFLDLDHFKQINDTHGHLFGDAVLKQVAQTISRSVRDCDVLARFGGEEFVVLVLCVIEDDLARIAERIRQAIEALSIRCGDQSVPVTASVGAALLLAHESPHLQPAGLIEAADRAMYDAKRNGRNQVRLVRCTSV